VYQLLQSGWWKTFLIIAAISFCVSFMMVCFPTSLPGEYKKNIISYRIFTLSSHS
jgi:hypothetical protein